MKKTLSFEKDLTFQTMIGSITTISFEEDLKFIDKCNVDGNFYISGKYKMTEASTLVEDFSFSVPIEIAMIENYDLSTTKITVSNFTYEVVDDDVLRCKIDILIEGVEEVIIEDDKNINDAVVEELEYVRSEKTEKHETEKKDVRECDGDIVKEEEKEIPIKKEEVKSDNTLLKKEERDNSEKEIPVKSQKKVSNDDNSEIDTKSDNSVIKVNSLFSNLDDTNDTFTTYSVYIMRDGDTLEKVMDKYKVKKEDLEVYNDLSTIELNSKVIIPTSSNE